MKSIRFHSKAQDFIRGLSKSARMELGEALLKLQLGLRLGLPLSRPMPDVYQSAHELRIRDSAGVYRIFYFLKAVDGILVFHAFAKKTEKTPQGEIELGRRRLLEMLRDE